MAQQSVELILLRQLSTSLIVPVFIVDDRGDLVFLNEAAERLLGMRLDAMDHLSFEAWTNEVQPRMPDGSAMPDDMRPLVKALTERVATHVPVLITGRDGVEHTVEITAFPLEGGRGRLIGAVAMFWEIQNP